MKILSNEELQALLLETIEVLEQTLCAVDNAFPYSESGCCLPFSGLHILKDNIYKALYS